MGVTLLAPLLGGAVLVWRSSSVSPLQSATTAQPTVVVVESAMRTGEASVVIAIREADPFAPRVHASGLVTAVRVVEGAEVASGQVVATVDGAELVAYSAPEPMWENVASGTGEPAVSAAQDVLQTLGYYAGPVDGRWGPRTRAAVVAFNAAHGYGRDNPVLAMSSLVWIGPSTVHVAKVELRPGDPATPGDPLFATDVGLGGIEVREPPSMVGGAEYVLEYAGTVAPYTLGSGLITDPIAVGAIVQDMGTLTEAAATLRLAEPIEVGVVPSSAVITDATGVTCIFPGITDAPQVVTPISGTLGSVALDPALVGTRVLVNPRETRTDLSCE